MTSSQNPYEPPRASLEVESAPPEEVLRAFLSENSVYYLARWQGLRSGSGGYAGFNWAAAFFSVYWLCYRRLYIWLIPYVVLVMLASFLPILFSGRAAQGIAQILVGVVLFVVVGLSANVILWNRALRVAKEFSSLADIRRAGGISVRSVWIALAVCVGVPVLAAVLVLALTTP